MDAAFLTVKNLSAWYNNEKMVLSDFSLKLASQNVVGLIGLNGSGKTTFLKVISGLLPTFRSEGILFSGKLVPPRERAFKMCRYTVFEEDNSFSYFTFREYLSYVFLMNQSMDWIFKALNTYISKSPVIKSMEQSCFLLIF